MIAVAFVAFWLVLWLVASIACKYVSVSVRVAPTIIGAIQVSNGAQPQVPMTPALRRAAADAEAAARAAARA